MTKVLVVDDKGNGIDNAVLRLYFYHLQAHLG